MSRKNSSKVRKPVASSSNQDQKTSWWKKNWLALASFAVAIFGLGVSIWAVRVSQAADRRAQQNEVADASAVATRLVGQVDLVLEDADSAQQTYGEASSEMLSHTKWGADLLWIMNDTHLPPLSPTNDDFHALSRAGNNTSGHLESCVKLRDLAEDKLNLLAKGKNKLFDPVEAAYVFELTLDLPGVIKACTQAKNDLQPLAVPDPELDIPSPSPKGEIARGPTIPPPPWLAHASSTN